jgi:hypothetical protein
VQTVLRDNASRTKKKAGDCDEDDGTYGEGGITNQRRALTRVLCLDPFPAASLTIDHRIANPVCAFSMGDIASGSKFGLTTLWIDADSPV